MYIYIYTVSFQIWLSWISMFFKCHKEYHLFIFGVGFEWCIVLRSSSHVFTTTAPVVQRALWLYSTSSPPPLARRMRGCAPSSGDFMASFSSVNFCENPRAHPGMPFPPPGTKALLRGYNHYCPLIRRYEALISRAGWHWGGYPWIFVIS